MSTATQTVPLTSTLVARFLRSNNYTQTLEAFIREAGLPADVGQVSSKNDWTIEGVLEEKKAFDQTLKFERYGNDKEKDVWTVPAPSKPTIIRTPTSSNLLAASVEPWQRLSDEGRQETKGPYIVATGADRQLHVLQTAANNDAVRSFSGLSDSPVLSFVSTRHGKHVLMTTMSGQMLLVQGSEVIDRRKDHTKYAIKVVSHEKESSDELWIATAGWDAKIFLYRMSASETTSPVVIGEPVARINMTANPESMLFVRHPDSGDLILLASQRDSTYLYYYEVEPSSPSQTSGEEATQPYACRLLGKQNLAPHSNAWIAFSPTCLALSPHDSGLVAVATSTLPHMKVIIVRLLFPSEESIDRISAAADTAITTEPVTQATQAMAALALQNREDAAILIQANTFALQTAYSTPQVVWRPDGSGVWVNGDDGVIRGIEAKTGKVVATLKHGHEPGSKVRTIWSGWVDVCDGTTSTREEWVVSGGFDKRLIVWKA